MKNREMPLPSLTHKKNWIPAGVYPEEFEGRGSSFRN